MCIKNHNFWLWFIIVLMKQVWMPFFLWRGITKRTQTHRWTDRKTDRWQIDTQAHTHANAPPKWMTVRVPRTLGRMTMKLTRWTLSPSLLQSLFRSHRSLIRLLCTACLARALRCIHLFARSFTHSPQSSWESGSCLWIECVDFTVSSVYPQAQCCDAVACIFGMTKLVTLFVE